MYFVMAMNCVRKHPGSLPSRAFRKGGFALVITVSLMVLLALLAVGLLSLSTITLRSSSEAVASSEARANARLALSIALGELQKSMGPDQRISANGSILAEDDDSDMTHPRWLGVWDSWKANDGDPAGEDEPSQHSTIGDAETGIHPSYKPNREDHFRSWLVSLNSEASGNLEAARSLSLDAAVIPTATQDAAILFGKGSLGEESEPEHQVKAPLVSIVSGSTANSNSGHFGWWIGDESQKANIMDNSYKGDDPNSLAERLNRQQAPASLGNSEISGLENLADQDPLSFMPSRKTLSLVDGVTERAAEQFHDVTTTSLGVLADVREGGLKRDLSTILERPIDPEEVYSLSSFVDFQRADSVKTGGDDFMLYRFDDMVDSISSTGEAAVPIQDLAAYYQLYDRYRSGSMGGIQYSSSESSPPNSNLSDGLMVSNPDYGDTQSDLDKYLRQYTALYRSPFPVKIEIFLS